MLVRIDTPRNNNSNNKAIDEAMSSKMRNQANYFTYLVTIGRNPATRGNRDIIFPWERILRKPNLASIFKLRD